MIELLLLWVVLFCILVFYIHTREGGGLTLAYFLNLSLIHVPGLLAFMDPASGFGGREYTRVGFEMTLIGLVAFLAGVILAHRANRRSGDAQVHAPRTPASVFERAGWRALAIGVVAYFVLIPVSGFVPSLTAVVSALATLLILGLWLQCYGAAAARDKKGTLAILALLPLLPLATLVTGGFIGYGIGWILSVVAFLFVIARRRFWFYLAAPLVLFLGLSLFVTYMGQRDEIRDVVWQERAGLFERIERVSTIITDFQMLDLQNTDHLSALNRRLNQNLIVGAGISRHEAGVTDLFYGGTVPWWLLVPRAIWPDKPEVGGGGELVTAFTGIQFAKGTSVGVGQVLEFYMNFGLPGVCIGFAALGFVLMRLDYGIMRALASGDMRGLILRAMPGLTLIQPGGNLLEIGVAAVAALVAAHLILKFGLFHVVHKVSAGRRAVPRRKSVAAP